MVGEADFGNSVTISGVIDAVVGTYLVCEECGSFGPPAAFITRDGIRLCFQCYYREDESAQQESRREDDRGSNTPPSKSETGAGD